MIKTLYNGLTALVLALLPLNANSETYTIGVVPQFEAREIADIWGHVASTLSNNTVYDFEFAGSANIPDFEKKFQNGDFDFIYSNPYHALMAYQQQGYVPSIRDGSLIEINEKTLSPRQDVGRRAYSVVKKSKRWRPRK